jgi:hypothetical protein
MNKLLTALLLTLLTSVSPVVQGDSETRDVDLRIHLIDIEAINTVTQSFTASLTIALRWQDPSLVHSGPNSISRPLDEIWFPRIQILNQQRLVSTLPRIAEVYPNGEVVQRQRYWGNFSQPLDLENFPFDSQRIQIKLAHVGFGEDLINLTPSSDSGISASLTMPDWDVTGWDLVAEDISLEQISTRLNGVVLSVDVKREEGFFIYKVIFPLILIVMMSWMVFWIDPSLAASQISVSVTAMLTMIAYRFALSGMVPRLAFLTTLDYFVLISTVVVFLSMIEVIYTAHLSSSGQLDKARKVDRQARWIAPVIYFTLAADIFFLGILF